MLYSQLPHRIYFILGTTTASVHYETPASHTTFFFPTERRFKGMGRNARGRQYYQPLYQIIASVLMFGVWNSVRNGTIVGVYGV